VIHENATARHLGLLRMLVFGMWIGDLVKDSAFELSRIPLAYYQPVGVLRWFPDAFWEAVLAPAAVRAWWGTLVALLVLAAAGVPCYRAVAVSACVLLTFWQGVVFGFTGVSHGPIAALYVAWILAVFPSADGCALRRGPVPPRPDAVYRLAILTAAAVLLATYMLVGVRRILEGGIEIFVDGSILRYIARNSMSPDYLSQGMGWRLFAYPGMPAILQAGFALVTLFEVTSLLCLASRWYRRAWLAVMLPFHVLSWPLLQLLFLHNILLVLALVVDVGGIARRLSRTSGFRAILSREA
jgi:hypothetical protein